MKNDGRIILTLDAGGTNFLFSAIKNGSIIGKPFRFPANASTLDEMLDKIVLGFQSLMDDLNEKVSAISFAFPGPADYEQGIIGDLENLPLFRGGVALGPFLENHFHIPVYINNDGDLFAMGEAIGGLLPKINLKLEKAGNPKRYKNLLGLTLGTGFGAGIVSSGQLYRGDNSAAAEINRMRNPIHTETSIEDSVSIRAVKRVYCQSSGISLDLCPEPSEIYKIALGQLKGDVKAANKAFEFLGKAVANATADALSLLDAIVVIGGGLSGAAGLFMPHLMKEMNRPFTTLSGEKLDRMEIKACSLMNNKDWDTFLQSEAKEILIPRSTNKITYHTSKKIGVGLSVLGTSEAIALGAYAYAIQKLDLKN